MKVYYCWRCRRTMPFLEENEWALISHYLPQITESIQRYRQEHEVGLEIALENAPFKAKEIFFAITGYNNVSPHAIYHHRLNAWGSECHHCGHLLRTPQANICVHCGMKR